MDGEVAIDANPASISSFLENLLEAAFAEHLD